MPYKQHTVIESPPRDPSRPEPDPSQLTTAQLMREAAHIRDTLNLKIDAIEKAIVVAHDDMVRVPTAMDKAVDGLRILTWQRFDSVHTTFLSVAALNEQKFGAIKTQFDERDTRVQQTAKASKEALDAALQAAKEAVSEQNKSNSVAIAKSEAATSKQIDQLTGAIHLTAKTTDDKVADLKERLTRIEGSGAGKTALWGFVVGGVGLVATMLTLVSYIMRMAR